MIVTEDDSETSTTYQLTALDHPPTCPVEGCSKVVEADKLPPHIIQNHDGALS